MQLPEAVWRKMTLTTVDIKLYVLISLKLAILLSLYFVLPCPNLLPFVHVSEKICNILDIPSSFWVFFFALSCWKWKFHIALQEEAKHGLINFLQQLANLCRVPQFSTHTTQQNWNSSRITSEHLQLLRWATCIEESMLNFVPTTELCTDSREFTLQYYI